MPQIFLDCAHWVLDDVIAPLREILKDAPDFVCDGLEIGEAHQFSSPLHTTGRRKIPRLRSAPFRLTWMPGVFQHREYGLAASRLKWTRDL